MKLKSTDQKVTIKWFVYAGDEKIPHTSHMRGEWGYDFECSCGYQSRTGGALLRYVRDLVTDHKIYEHNYEIAYYHKPYEIGR